MSKKSTKLIATTQELSDFCARLTADYPLMMDTEFMRERTYYPHLCLIQLCWNGIAIAVDPLAEGLDLTPFWGVLDDPQILKVMHGCRQDLEIFYHLNGRLPVNVVDTQIAAMVCGFGESVSYKNLVEHYTKGTIDKGQRFTDWSLRPLSDKQIDYALADVTYLEELYPQLMRDLKKNKRESWIAEEMDALLIPETYVTQPIDAWMKIKSRIDKPKRLAILREIAAWREQKAQHKDVPRGRILKDECLIEIANNAPQTVEALLKVRGVSDGFAQGDYGKAIIEAVKRAENLKPEERPVLDKKTIYPAYIGPTVELLKVLLRLKSEEHNVASKLIVSGDDLYELAFRKDPDIAVLKGWRFDIFGKDALALKDGKISLALDKKGAIKVIPVAA